MLYFPFAAQIYPAGQGNWQACFSNLQAPALTSFCYYKVYIKAMCLFLYCAFIAPKGKCHINFK